MEITAKLELRFVFKVYNRDEPGYDHAPIDELYLSSPDYGELQSQVIRAMIDEMIIPSCPTLYTAEFLIYRQQAFEINPPNSLLDGKYFLDTLMASEEYLTYSKNTRAKRYTIRLQKEIQEIENALKSTACGIEAETKRLNRLKSEYEQRIKQANSHQVP